MKQTYRVTLTTDCHRPTTAESIARSQFKRLGIDVNVENIESVCISEPEVQIRKLEAIVENLRDENDKLRSKNAKLLFNRARKSGRSQRPGVQRVSAKLGYFWECSECGATCATFLKDLQHHAWCMA